MDAELCARIQTIIAIETAIAGIYSGLVRLCPEEWRMFHYLSRVEENHAMVASLAGKYCQRGRLPDGFLSAYPLGELERILSTARELNSRVDKRDIRLAEALERTLALEERACKVYFGEMLREETASDAVEKLKRLLTDTDLHIEYLREAIAKNKFPAC